MPGVLINWKAEHAYPRLIAALVATIDTKIDYNKIAAVYGQGATYNNIEGRFRIIKKEALEMKAALGGGATEGASAGINGAAGGTAGISGTGVVGGSKKKGTEKKAMVNKKDKVITGRVTKAPMKKGAGAAAGAGKRVRAETGAGMGAETDTGNTEKRGVMAALQNGEDYEEESDAHSIKEEV